MKHLFIINPLAEKIKGNTRQLVEEITAFFKNYSQFSYDIHITRWCRDAEGFTRRYAAAASDLVRVHAMGGTGTLYEVINGVIGLPNAQVASHPCGRSNSFIRYFGADKIHLFGSLRNQVFSGTTPIDAVRCGLGFCICYGMVGLEAYSNYIGDQWVDSASLHPDLAYLLAAVRSVFIKNDFIINLNISADGIPLSGNYVSVLTANQPCYGINLAPAVDAHPNDGFLDLYMIRPFSKLRALNILSNYINGNYLKISDIVSHLRCRSVSISSESPICMDTDGETFFESSLNLEVIPYAIDFVCPTGINIEKLPKIYGNS